MTQDEAVAAMTSVLAYTRRLEAVVRDVRRLNASAKTDAASISLDDAMDGPLAAEWARISREMDAILPDPS